MKRPALATVLTVFVYAALVAAVAFAFFTQQQRIDTLSHVVEGKNQSLADKDAQLSKLLDNYAALADDCFEAADCTTTTPSVSVIERSLPGVQGDPGPAGPGASDSQVAEQVREYCAARDDCRGIRGADGRNGTDGADGRDGTNGVNGADSTTPGPRGNAGPQGPQGPQGLPGDPGTPGEPGVAGEPGAPGEPGVAGEPPVSWTFTDALGITHTCTRTDPFDASAPTYQCD